MKNLLILTPLLVLATQGCVAGMAASAAGMAVRSAQGKPVDNSQYRPAAISACSARAAPYGAVRIIDVEQRSISKLVVWGTAGEGAQRQSFECSFGTSVTGFKLRRVPVAGS